MSIATLSTTLTLLHGPTNAAVKCLLSGAALGVGGVATLSAISSPAYCFTYRQPYDEDVFKSETKTTDGSDGPSSTYTSYKPYTKTLRPIAGDAFDKLTSRSNITITLVRNVGIASLFTINRWLAQAYEAEEKAAPGDEPDLPPFPLAELKASLPAGLFNACLDWTTQMIRSLLDWGAHLRLSLPLGRRIRKELRASAFRKSHYPPLLRPLRVFKTSLFSEATLYIADCIVACSMEIYNAVRRTAIHGYRLHPRRFRLLLVRCGLQAFRCSCVWVAISVGNGVGSAAPRRSRGLAMFVCAQVAGMSTNLYVNGWSAELLSRGGGGGGGFFGGFLGGGGGGDGGEGGDDGAPPSVPAQQQAQEEEEEVEKRQISTTSTSSTLDDIFARLRASEEEEEQLQAHVQQQQQQVHPPSRPIRGGPRLPERRQHQQPRPAPQPQAQPQPQAPPAAAVDLLPPPPPLVAGAVVAGPDTPQAARDAARPIAPVAAEAVPPVQQQQQEEEEDLGAAVGGGNGGVMPPQTPPTADTTDAGRSQIP